MKEGDFVVHKILFSDIEKQYFELYDEIFKDYDYLQIPCYIYIGFYKSEYVGFISTYLHNIDTIYMEYSGFVDKFRGVLAVGLFKHAIDYIHKDYNNIICRIDRDNTSALKLALNIGFKIVGIRAYERVWVEMFKTKYEEEMING